MTCCVVNSRQIELVTFWLLPEKKLEVSLIGAFRGLKFPR